MYHNITLPNGDVSLCCMDYGLEHIIGNLLEQDYEDVIPDNNACFNLCRFCENGGETRMNDLQELLNYFISNPEEADINFKLANYYNSIGQTASAVSYYIRTSERTSDTKRAYSCLLAAANCLIRKDVALILCEVC